MHIASLESPGSGVMHSESLLMQATAMEHPGRYLVRNTHNNHAEFA